MEEAIKWVMNIDSWQQVAVLVLCLGYLAYRQWRNDKKTEQVKAQVETANQGVAATNAGVTAVLHQVENNSGTSLKDAVDRIETGQAELVEMFGEHVIQSEKDSERLGALEAKYLDPRDKGL